MNVTAKRVFRVVLVLLLVLLVVYLALVDARNPQTVILPLLISLPTAWVLGIALLLGFAVGWVSLAGRVFKLQRENRTLRQRLIRAGLEPTTSEQTRFTRRQQATNETSRP